MALALALARVKLEEWEMLKVSALGKEGAERWPMVEEKAWAYPPVGQSEPGAPRLDRDPLPSAVALKRMVTVKALRQAASEHRIG
jgi:hypothetical protein